MAANLAIRGCCDLLPLGFHCLLEQLPELRGTQWPGHERVEDTDGQAGEEIRRAGFEAVVFANEVRTSDPNVMRDGTEKEDSILDIIAEMDTVVNTVPSLVITEDIIEKMSKESLIVDIASSPGGTDFAAAKTHGITAKLALGLPGIYTTSSSAELLKNAISKYAPLQKDVREDRQWIFQIII